MTIGESRRQLDQGLPALPVLVEQLYWSIDRILVDMDIQEGPTVTFRHKIKTIRTRAVPAEQEVNKKVTESWKPVSKSEYERRKGQLGLAIEQKPAGKYDQEVERVAQPPGYRYVAEPSVGRNHYGYWGHSRGLYYWHWYPRYHYMHNTYWGRSYGRVRQRDYESYAAANRSGRSYEGRDQAGRKAFGSTGSATKSTYAASKYVKTGGHRNTQYVRSGGTYRGSKYTSRRSSHRSSGRSSSGWSRSGSRSGGGGK